MEYVILALDNMNDIPNLLNLANGSNKNLIGSWKGQMEYSFLVTRELFELVKAFGYVSNQEAFLVLGDKQKGGRRLAWLEYQDGEREYIGLFQSVPREEAIKHDGWTYDIESDTYYIVK